MCDSYHVGRKNAFEEMHTWKGQSIDQSADKKNHKVLYAITQARNYFSA